MSIIGEIKEQIARASESLDEAQRALTAARAAHEKAMQGVNQAAGDSGHPKIDKALMAFVATTEKINEVSDLIAGGQAAVNDYAQGL